MGYETRMSNEKMTVSLVKTVLDYFVTVDVITMEMNDTTREVKKTVLFSGDFDDIPSEYNDCIVATLNPAEEDKLEIQLVKYL